MDKKELIQFVKDNFYVDRTGELQFRWQEDTSAILKPEQIAWLVKQGVEDLREN